MLDAEFLLERFDAGDSEAVSGVFDVFGAVCAEDAWSASGEPGFMMFVI